MNTEILGVILQLVCLVGLSYPLGRYIAKVYKGEKTWSDFMAPIERWIYKFSGINPELETVPQGIAHRQSLLVLLGNDPARFTGYPAVESRR